VAHRKRLQRVLEKLVAKRKEKQNDNNNKQEKEMVSLLSTGKKKNSNLGGC